jgi:hypothetical protein
MTFSVGETCIENGLMRPSNEFRRLCCQIYVDKVSVTHICRKLVKKKPTFEILLITKYLHQYFQQLPD